ncbi:hypothetical protein OIDMADRAFT_18462 [Oidiodendron maius Zn]|uniref:Uncharacterized protein n=1 Tax=Oidiodendron maius (strain Zn) TaxID=913774 RepID=A0A0C3DLB6_OIDMZ|nr:hypothetical protein OIDMADRAFT_18462 [Oidiodendron maius Zn]
MSRDTGFTEPFNKDRNTTLPHPDADTSGNASIQASGILRSSPTNKQRQPFHNKVGNLVHEEMEKLEESRLHAKQSVIQNKILENSEALEVQEPEEGGSTKN